MEKIWMKNWPQDLPGKIFFKHGAIHLHEYLRIQAEKIPDKPAIIFYGRKITFIRKSLF